MIVISTKSEPLSASLRQRCTEAEQLILLCQECSSRLSNYASESRMGLVLGLLELGLNRYLEAMKAQGIEPTVGQYKPLGKQPTTIEHLYVRFATLRDETWACQRLAQDHSGNVAYFLERQALQLEPLLRALEYAGQPQMGGHASR